MAAEPQAFVDQLYPTLTCHIVHCTLYLSLSDTAIKKKPVLHMLLFCLDFHKMWLKSSCFFFFFSLPANSQRFLLTMPGPLPPDSPSLPSRSPIPYHPQWKKKRKKIKSKKQKGLFLLGFLLFNHTGTDFSFFLVPWFAHLPSSPAIPISLPSTTDKKAKKFKFQEIIHQY